jgi:hypothetical protein
VRAFKVDHGSYPVCEQDSECFAGEKCIDGQCTEVGCNIVWYDGDTVAGTVPTQETSRTQQAVQEAHVAIYGEEPNICSFNWGVFCLDGVYGCARPNGYGYAYWDSKVCESGYYYEGWDSDAEERADSLRYTWDVECVPVN